MMQSRTLSRRWITLVALLVWVPTATAVPPRVIVTVLVDDLGFAGISANRVRYGQPTPLPPEVVTPALDGLAAEGVLLDRLYVHPFCSPSRSAFLSGRLPVHVQQDNLLPTQPGAGVPRFMTMLSTKLAAEGAGYSAHHVGKWDAGAQTWDHTPEGRGFASSLGYFGHRVNYWTQVGDGCNNMDVFDGTVVDFWDSGGPATALNGTGYVDYLFVNRSLEVINSFAAGGTPFPTSNGPRAAAGERLWLNLALHSVHDPIQAPQAVMAQLNYTADDETVCNETVVYVWPGSRPADIACRRIYEALLKVADTAVAAVVAQLKALGLWQDTLLILSADNGGQQYMMYNAASNWPLRGGKGSDFEGGIRAAALVSGGYLPPAVRGTVQSGLMHIADWYATLCGLAGVDPYDARAAAAGLPPVDSLDMWPMLSGANATSPRTSFPVSANTLVSGDWKYMQGTHSDAGWTAAMYPNASSPARGNDPYVVSLKCGTGPAACLFNVSGDASEHADVASQYPAVAQALAAQLAAAKAAFFTNNESYPWACPPGVDPADCACWMANNRYGGFVGPFQL